MKIGLLSDTHSDLDPKIFTHFAACDEIWHAGDIGDVSVADALQHFKPLRGVYGNVDDSKIRQRFPEDLRFTCEGLPVLITHIGGSPPTYNPRTRNLFKEELPAIFICGHSHILKVMRDPAQHDLLYLNPGAAGNHGFHAIKTLLRFEILGKKIQGMEVIELGKRGQLPK